MKKILTIVLLGLILVTPTIALAQTPKPAKGSCENAVSDKDKEICKEINAIFKVQNVKGTENLQRLSERVTSNKEATYSDFFASIIKILTGVAVVMTFVGICVAGGIFVFSEGEEGRVTKARTIIVYTIIGDLIIAASYAIVKGITLIKPL